MSVCVVRECVRACVRVIQSSFIFVDITTVLPRARYQAQFGFLCRLLYGSQSAGLGGNSPTPVRRRDTRYVTTRTAQPCSETSPNHPESPAGVERNGGTSKRPTAGLAVPLTRRTMRAGVSNLLAVASSAVDMSHPGRQAVASQGDQGQVHVLSWRGAALGLKGAVTWRQFSEFRSCVKVEVAVLGFPS